MTQNPTKTTLLERLKADPQFREAKASAATCRCSLRAQIARGDISPNILNRVITYADSLGDLPVALLAIGH
jgi:hypothetical protein